MKFRDKSISTLYAYALAAVFALTLAGCGGSGGSAMDMDDDDDMPMGTSQATCEGAGGRYNADDTCSSAEDLEAERIAAAVQAERERIEAEQAAAAEAARAVKAARDAAGLASMAAAASVTAAEAHKDLDLETFVRARIAAENAEAAADAALLATDPGAAEAAQADAEAAAADAKKYSDMVLAMAKAITDMMAEDAAAAEVIRLAMVEANALQSAKGDAQAAYDAAAAALAAVDPYKGSDLASHTRATDALQAVSDANDDVQAAGTAAAAEALIAAVEEARDVVTGFTGMVTAAKAEDDRVAAVKAEEDRLAAEAQDEVDAKTASAATKVKAIGAEGDGGLGGAALTYSAAIKYGSVAIKDSAMAGDDDPKFVQMMDFGDGRTMHVRDNGKGEEEVVIISSDIDAPKSTPFTDVYTPVAAGGTNAGTLLIVVGTGMEEDGQGFASRLKASQFVLAEDGTAAFLTFPRYQLDSNENSVDGNQTVAAFETTATFDGGTGTLKCAATSGDGCTVTLDEKGEITVVSPDWRFAPDADTKVDVDDADHLSYGFWLKRTTDEDGVLTYNNVETFVSSSAGVSGALTGVEGDATYEGGAVGVYVHHVNPGGGSKPDSSTSGHFTADVSLTAYFGMTDTSVAADKHNTVEGTIDEFTLFGEDGEVPNDWSVEVQGDISATGTIQNEVDSIATAKGGNGDGSFTGTFHGSVAEVDAVVPQPGSIIGEFNADFTNGTAAGAYGARIKK